MAGLGTAAVAKPQASASRVPRIQCVVKKKKKKAVYLAFLRLVVPLWEEQRKRRR